jgi:hypothetical protein
MTQSFQCSGGEPNAGEHTNTKAQITTSAPNAAASIPTPVSIVALR